MYVPLIRSRQVFIFVFGWPCLIVTTGRLFITQRLSGRLGQRGPVYCLPSIIRSDLLSLPLFRAAGKAPREGGRRLWLAPRFGLLAHNTRHNHCVILACNRRLPHRKRMHPIRPGNAPRAGASKARPAVWRPVSLFTPRQSPFTLPVLKAG